MKEWKEYKLGDIVEANTSLYSTKDKWEKALYLDTGNITENRIENIQEFDCQFLPSRAKRKVKHEDIIFSTVRPNQRHYGFITNPVHNLLVSTGFAVLSVKKEFANPKFVYYWLCRNEIIEHLQNIAEQSVSAYPSIKASNICDLEIELPSLKNQIKIACILSSLDDKIELNRRINENLEQQAQALFKSWFVDFEPFKKCEFIESELGIIPKGWRVIPISEIFNFQEGPGIRNWQYVNNNGTKFINIRCINNNIINVSNANMISNEEAQGKYAHFMLNENDIVMSCSGTLGRSAIVLKEYLPLCLNTSVIRFTPKIERQLGLLYGYLGSSLFLNKQMELATGSAQVNFGPTHLKEMSIAVPNDDILNNFSDIVNSMIIKKKAIISEIIHLNNLRDTLLPKLMSGELKLSEIETKLDE